MRTDLLVRLVHAGIQDDKSTFREIVAAMIAEERAMQHHVLADQLEARLQAGPDSTHGKATLPDPGTLPLAPKSCPATRSARVPTRSDPRPGNQCLEILPKRRLSSLVLPAAIRALCQDVIQEQHRTALLRSYNIEPRNRLLFLGPPGNGKTSLAEALAEALIVPLYTVRSENIPGASPDETVRRLNSLFDFAATQHGVLLFDDFESLARERGDPHAQESGRLVGPLLQRIARLPSHVVVIAATNHPELLDRAVWRHFQVRLTLPAPAPAALLAWLQDFEQRIGTSLDTPLPALAQQLPVTSFAEAEDFGQCVFRQYILGKPDSSMREIVARTLQSWPICKASAPGQA